ncbi:MAG TPA: hypothetical protein VF807_00815 [Ktedonobacterales bacterium]
MLNTKLLAPTLSTLPCTWSCGLGAPGHGVAVGRGAWVGAGLATVAVGLTPSLGVAVASPGFVTVLVLEPVLELVLATWPGR